MDTSEYSSFDISRAFGKHDYQFNDVSFREKLFAHPVIQGLFTIGDYFILVANMHTMNIEYMGGECETVSGYSEEEIRSLQGNFFPVFSMQEDTKFSLEVVKIGIDYHQSRPLDERELIYVVYYYRAYKKDGQLIHVQHQSIPILFDTQMIPYIFANIVTNITHLGLTSLPQATVINRSAGEKFHVNPNSLKLTKPKDLFTEREKEVLRLVAVGLSSTQIGERLFISKETVRTHRKNILKKASCTNTSQLVGYAITHALL